jgi:hypothetical protein
MKSIWISGMLVVLAQVSCTTQQQSAAVIGGVAGGLLGAAFGDDHQDVVAGAAVGAGLGAGAAAIQENEARRRDYERYGIPPQQGGGYRQGGSPPPPPPTSPPPRAGTGDYPTATWTDVPNQVRSPYPPHGKIDVTGFRSGQLAKDPKSGRIFRVP